MATHSGIFSLRTRMGSIFLLFMAINPACRCVSGGENGDRGHAGHASPTSQEDGDAWTQGRLPAAALEGTPRPGGEIVVHVHSEPPSLNTIVDSDAIATYVTDARVYESLLIPDRYDHPNYRHKPLLASALPEISEDGRVHTFTLRQGVRWHDGKPFSSEDVMATFDKVRDEAVRAEHIRSYLAELESIEAPDPQTVRFRWKRPYFLVMDMPYSGVPIQPAHVLRKLTGEQYNESTSNPLNRHPVGTGPMKFLRWVSGERIEMARNEHYWGRKAYLDKVTYRIIKELKSALLLAERGELDVLTRVESEAWTTMNQPYLREHYWRSKFYDNNYAWIGWNQQRPFFADAKVRNALTMLVDRPGIIRSILYGLPRPTHCHFYPPTPECDFGKDEIPFDPPAAVKLLEEAGWTDHNGNGIRDKNGVEFRFAFMLPAGSREAGLWVTKIKEDFDRAGIRMDIQRQEWTTFLRRLREKEFDACTLLWVEGTPRGDPTQIWHSNSIEGGSNYIGFSNPRVDEILDQARITLDQPPRTELYKEFSQILYDEQPYTFMYVRPRLALVSKRLRGVQESLMWWFPQDWWLAEDAEEGH